jgi:hypothetical protein
MDFLMKERRNHPRARASLSVLFSKDIYPKLTVATILNLGFGGVQIKSLYSLNKGDRLDLTLGLPTKAVKCQGRVMYALKSKEGSVKAGIRFDLLPVSDRLYLGQYLSYLRGPHLPSA